MTCVPGFGPSSQPDDVDLSVDKCYDTIGIYCDNANQLAKLAKLNSHMHD